MKTPIYDPRKTYQQNFDHGPFGDINEIHVNQPGNPKHSFLGYKIHTPFGIPAGPLLNSNFIKAAFRSGFNLPTYKTVRSQSWPCHPFPNILAVHPGDKLILNQTLKADKNYNQPLSITNSFGVPSPDPSYWQIDMQKAVKSAAKGQIMIASFQGTKQKTFNDFLKNHVLTAKLVKETSAKILELNLSCPNEGTGNLLCFDISSVRKITFAIKSEIGNTPLLLKLAYFKDKDILEKLITETQDIVQGYTVINTIPAKIINESGEPALPGTGRQISGICGSSIKWAGLNMVKFLSKLKKDKNYNYEIVACGGLENRQDYQNYIEAGANAAMSATAAMWNPYLAKQVISNY